MNAITETPVELIALTIVLGMIILSALAGCIHCLRFMRDEAKKTTHRPDIDKILLFYIVLWFCVMTFHMLMFTKMYILYQEIAGIEITHDKNQHSPTERTL